MDWFDLLEVQGTLKSLLQHHSSKASILWCSAFFMVQLSHPYMTTGKTIALTRWTFISKVMSLLFNMLSRFDDEFLTYHQYQMREWRDVSVWGFPGPEWLGGHLSMPRAGFLACAPCQSWKRDLHMFLWALDRIPGPELPGHCRVFTSQSSYSIIYPHLREEAPG